jgi:glyoxylase-like metal-dependent hydrolase (beta-lactamase superfamily II)
MPLKAAIVPVTPFMQNCTLLWDETSNVGAVVDPGGDVDRIRIGITKAGMTVEKIIITHGHIDHAGGAAQLKAELGGIPIEGPHLADKFLLDNLEGQGAHFALDGVRNVTPDRWLDEGDTVSVDRRIAASSLGCCARDPPLPSGPADLRAGAAPVPREAGARRPVPSLRSPPARNGCGYNRNWQ